MESFFKDKDFTTAWMASAKVIARLLRAAPIEPELIHMNLKAYVIVLAGYFYNKRLHTFNCDRYVNDLLDPALNPYRRRIVTDHQVYMICVTVILVVVIKHFLSRL